MLTFHNTIDARCREVSKPQVARLIFAHGQTVYVVIGTEYGYLHTTSGDVRFWQSYSGAYRGMRQYVGI